MSFFQGSQQPRGSLPNNIVASMEMFGRFEFDPQGTGVGRGIDIGQIGMIEPQFCLLAQNDPAAFVTALSETVLPVGGWAVYGASRLIRSLLGFDYSDPAADAIRMAGLQWMRDNNVPPMRIAEVDWEFWLNNGGKDVPWLPTRPGYHPEDTPITDLAIEEARRIVQLTAEPDSNVILAYRNGEHAYMTVIDAPYSDEDPRRSQRVGIQAETLRDLYTQLGSGLQLLPFWCDSELEAFIPYDRPRIPV